MATIYKQITMTSQGSTSGPLYDIYYSVDGVTYTLCPDGDNVLLPSVGSTAIVTVEDTANFIKAVNLHPGCEGNDVIVNFGGLTTTTTTSGPTTTTTQSPTTTTTIAPTTTTTTLGINCYIYSWACDNEYGVPCSLNWTNCDGTPGSDFVSNGSSGTQCARQGTFGISNASFPTEGASCSPTTTTTTAAPTTTTTSTTSTTTTTTSTTSTTTTTAAPTYVAGAYMIYDVGNPSSYSGTGTTINDVSGNGRNGTLVNSPSYSSSNGGYLQFTRANSQYIEYSGLYNSAFTVQLILKYDSSDRGGCYPQFYSSTSTGNLAANIGYDCGFGTNGLFGLIYHGASGTSANVELDAQSNQSIENTWAMLSHTGNGSNTWQLITNNDYTHIITAPGGTYDRTTFTPSNQTVRIGYDSAAGIYNTYKFMGYLVYDRVLTQSEITQNYNLFSSRF
jgi:hypothetical protein